MFWKTRLRNYRFVLVFGVGFLDNDVMVLCYPNIDWVYDYSHLSCISVLFEKIFNKKLPTIFLDTQMSPRLLLAEEF